MVRMDLLSIDEIALIARYLPLCDLSSFSRATASTRRASALALLDLVQGASKEGNVSRALNQRQQQAYIEATLFGRNLFITGGAGVGKSFVSHHIIKTLRLMILSGNKNYFPVEGLDLTVESATSPAAKYEPVRTMLKNREAANSMNGVAVTASTGTAAQLVNGLTLHARFGIQVRDESDIGVEEEGNSDLGEDDDLQYVGNPGAKKQKALRILCTKLSKQLIRGTRVLVIDEVSMVHAETLDALDYGLRHQPHFHPDIPFGGVQLIAIGDWLQLPPVSTNQTTTSAEYTFAFQSKAWRWMRPATVHLTEVMRQDPEERRFVNTLNEMRLGKLSMQDAKWLSKSCPYVGGSQQEREHAPLTLLHKNRRVREINEQRLNELETPVMEFPAIDLLSVEQEFYNAELGPKSRTTSMIRCRIASPWTHPPSSYHLQPSKKASDVCVIKIGCRVRCIRNMYNETDTELLVANGQTGTVVGCENESAAADPSIINTAALIVKWDPVRTMQHEPDEVVEALTLPVRRMHFLKRKILPPHIAPSVLSGYLDRQPELASGNNYRMVVTTDRQQFPLEVCYAKTVHNAQGSTWDRRIDLDLADVCYQKIDDDGTTSLAAPEGLLYTALSRITSLHNVSWLNRVFQRKLIEKNGLYTRLSLAPEHVVANEYALAFYEQNVQGAIPRWLADITTG